MRRKINFKKFDKVLFFTPILIFLIGIFSIYSASFKAHQAFDDTLAVKQLLWLGIAVLLVLLIIRLDYFRLLDWAWPLYLASVFLLVVVLFTPARLGAHRWINIAGFNIQPSEIAKLSVILMLSRFFTNHRFEYISKARLIQPFLIVGVPFLLILKEPDLGTGLILIPVFFSMLYLWGFPLKKIGWMILAGILASPVLVLFLKEYQRTRLMVFMNPNLDPLGSGYTIIQSKIAIGSGGWIGKGLMSGTQNRLQFLPEKHTDFIFGVIGEEGGFLATTAVTFLFALLVVRCFSVCAKTPERFGSQLACGVSTMIGIQAVINLGMTMGLLPVVGVPLPLISYGGTSIVITMVCIAILINIKIHRPLF